MLNVGTFSAKEKVQYSFMNGSANNRRHDKNHLEEMWKIHKNGREMEKL